LGDPLGTMPSSAHEARDKHILNEQSGVTMNRDRLLDDAKDKVLELAQDYTPPEPKTFEAPGMAVYIEMLNMISGLEKGGFAGPYDAVLLKAAATVLTSGGLAAGTEVTEQRMFDDELREFMKRVKDPATHEKLLHMLTTGKALMDKNNPVVQARVQAEAQGISR